MIGRKEELKSLDWDMSRPESQLVVVYGRRRIGKTYLIREKFADQFAFYHTGLRDGSLRDQLNAFRASLVQYGYLKCPRLTSWIDAFTRLSELIAAAPAGRKVIFIDEMPWMDTPRSKMVSSFEYFWNNQVLSRKEKDVFMVVCGSATSWIVENIVHNKGGLHDRLTDRIWLRPFTLRECSEYAAYLGVSLSRHELCQAYMIFGGVPYYWSLLRGDRSFAQNVDALCFSEHGKLRDEFDYLYSSLFHDAGAHLKIVTALAACKSGITRDELVAKTGITNGGTLKKALEELVRCDFVRQFNAWHKKNRDAFFQLTDNFTLFHFSFIKGPVHDSNFWMNSVGGPRLANWEGQSFERVCLLHIDQIKKALGISGIGCEVYSWRSRAESQAGRGAQIDLVIERQDGNVNLCEMKFYRTPYEITAEEEAKLLNRREAFRTDTGTSANCRILAPCPPHEWTGRGVLWYTSDINCNATRGNDMESAKTAILTTALALAGMCSPAAELFNGRDLSGWTSVCDHDIAPAAAQGPTWSVVVLEITVTGDEVSNRLNGTELDRVKGLRTRKGAIGLQSEGGAIEFRNITVDEVRQNP